MLVLRRPEATDEAAILEMMAEFIEADSAHDGGFWQPDQFHYGDWLEANQLAEMGIGISDGWVPAIQFVAFDNGRAIGFLSLRLRLNDHLINHGGHIGYSVRPSARGNGFAKEMLKQGISAAISKNIPKILLTCHEENAASRAVILANGGVLEDIREGTERYWIGGNHEQSKTPGMEE
ncbi:GNAT family N-acetyltransferase [Streptococcus loxodontisalivarius]|uniref:Acetyltransferase n=1 Tax=Streptococcus loxodontisalivarius TaxID=1349415 RepID=A0ABS2PPR1_9STRE|nr:GNAT family N-acetyltransferase [Streptococcus loxodontisalivarius]MBM7641960.1 putative acetyltransferase [Streptococcus loxodontisalivarius]